MLHCINAFEDVMKDLESEELKMRQRQRVLERRQNRKNREAFEALLKELEDQGKLHAEALWRTIYPEVAKVWGVGRKR